MNHASSSRTSLSCMLILALTGLSCSRLPPTTATLSEFPERYRFLKTVGVSLDDLPGVRAQLPYERIERSDFNPWTWGGPTITLERDGRASKNEETDKSGEVSIFDFGALCYLIERIHFESFQPNYSWGGFDATTVTIKVWRVGSDEPIVVADDGGVGPADLWTLSAAIEGVASRIDWK